MAVAHLSVQAAIEQRRRQALVQAYFAASNANDWGSLKANTFSVPMLL